ncbi:hypothetical protein GJ496_009914 [Pomphorhynchus laevis]|nr:hypothetical protein GJ496_009914 [Pomphorhynchus laevis]
MPSLKNTIQMKQSFQLASLILGLIGSVLTVISCSIALYSLHDTDEDFTMGIYIITLIMSLSVLATISVQLVLCFKNITYSFTYYINTSMVIFCTLCMFLMIIGLREDYTQIRNNEEEPSSTMVLSYYVLLPSCGCLLMNLAFCIQIMTSDAF